MFIKTCIVCLIIFYVYVWRLCEHCVHYVWSLTLHNYSSGIIAPPRLPSLCPDRSSGSELSAFCSKMFKAAVVAVYVSRNNRTAIKFHFSLLTKEFLRDDVYLDNLLVLVVRCVYASFVFSAFQSTHSRCGVFSLSLSLSLSLSYALSIWF